MKKGICIVILCLLVASGFGQIDSSAWDEKVVLLVGNQAYDKHEIYKTSIANWYLTDSIHFVMDTVLKRDLNSFGADTVVITFNTKWQKAYTNKNCLPSSDLNDCMIWTIVQMFEFKNFQTQEWETYIFSLINGEQMPLKKLQELITNQAIIPSYEGKKVIVRNHGWSKEFESWVQGRFKGFEIVVENSYDFEFSEKYRSCKRAEALYLLQRYQSNLVEVVDLKTHRVIEKIKIPVSKE